MEIFKLVVEDNEVDKIHIIIETKLQLNENIGNITREYLTKILGGIEDDEKNEKTKKHIDKLLLDLQNEQNNI